MIRHPMTISNTAKFPSWPSLFIHTVNSPAHHYSHCRETPSKKDITNDKSKNQCPSTKTPGRSNQTLKWKKNKPPEEKMECIILKADANKPWYASSITTLTTRGQNKQVLAKWPIIHIFKIENKIDIKKAMGRPRNKKVTIKALNIRSTNLDKIQVHGLARLKNCKKDDGQ